MTINLISNAGSIHHSQVEWDTLCSIISQFAYFDSNKRSVVETVFSGNPQGLQKELQNVSDYLKHISDDQRQVLIQILSRLPGDNSLNKFLSHLSKSGTLNFSELNKVALLAEAAAFIRNDFPNLPLPEFETINEQDHVAIQRKVLKEFRHMVDTTGELHLDRHPELAEFTKRLRELEDRIRKTVQEWINEPSHQKVLQFNSYDIHYDRYVVPVRSDSYRSELGLIVSRSDSGSTLFVEPFIVREACNKRMELIAKIDEIINQLALKFSLGFSLFSGFLELIHIQILRVDFYLAKTAFANSYHLVRPVLRETPGFRCSSLFHPLIKNAVRNDVDCRHDHHGIVISGPNTGGKTVFLKSIALSYLMFFHGHYVPAREAELYPYDGLFYFGDDLQDLKSGLSSFSGEVKNYIELMENILPTNLILIDEIFNSTSSDEASALSMAYFDELHKRAQCHIIVSTHHQMFKTLIHQNRQYISCHVGFDTKKMQPTYKIIWGTPGSSMAIEIFRILSRQNESVRDIPNRALSQLTHKNVSYETLLQRVTERQIELDQLLSANYQHELELKNQKGAMEGVLGLRLQEEIQKARKEVDRILDEARVLVEEARRKEIVKVRRIDDKAHALKSDLNRIAGNDDEVQVETPQGNLTITDIKQGDVVHSLTLKKDFIVHAIDARKQEVMIAKGTMKISVPLSTLVRTKNSLPSHHVSVSFSKTRNAQIELDVRGMRLAECQSMIERSLGDLLSGDVPYISVIHGHGDGVLKNWLRAYLKKSRDFIGELSENGNDGETKVVLRI
jgi:DNA mismatch repair protein MutS2